ncbi:MAG: aminopeptidase P family protein [Acutalibacter sp.]
MTNEIFARRRQKVVDTLKDQSALFLFSGDVKQRSLDGDYPFCVNRNFFYLTGLDEPGYVLQVSKLAGQVTQTLYLPRPDPYQELYFGRMPTAEEMVENTGLDRAVYLDKMEWELNRLFARNYFEHLYMDFHKRELNTVAYPENDLAARIMQAHPYLQPHNIARTIDNLRRFKDEGEIAQIKEAIRITGLGIESILRHMGPGINERQLQAYFEFELKYHGAMGNAFDPIIAAGANTVNLHYGRNNQDLKDGDLLLLDLGGEVGYYSADISRTFPVNGVFDSRQRYYYEAVLAANQAVIDALRPGLPVDDTLEIARDTLFAYCVQDGLTKERKDMEKLLPHGVSHYLGLDTHDVGDRGLLEPGMVVTVEPGIYLRDSGLGIRIEDDVLITETGHELLSPQILKTPSSIEDFIKQHKERMKLQ